jgi:dynein heavy chain
MGIQFNPKEGTLRDLIKRGVDNHLDHIEEVSETASKEFSLSTALLKMEREWDTLELVIINYKNKGVLVL